MLALMANLNISVSHADEWDFEIAPYLWTAGIDGDSGAPRRTTDVDVSFSEYMDLIDLGAAFVFEGQVGYKPFDWENTSVVGGLRYINVDTEIEFEDRVNLDISDNFMDPYAGVLWRSFVNDRWELSFQFDVGGGNDADLVIGGIAGASYHFNDKYNLKMSYRFLDVDFESDDLVFDALMQGVQIGFGIRF